LAVRIPQTPKSVSQLLSEIGAAPDRLVQLMGSLSRVSQDPQYLHWNDIRRRPSPEGMNHEEWWLLIKMARMPNRSIPLLDKKSTPFKFTIPDKVAAHLHQIDLGLGSSGSLPDAVTHPSSRNEYVISTLIQESITSSQLEGAVTTREVAKEMLRSGRMPRDKSESMILNNYRTMQRIMDLRRSALTPELIFELHCLVTAGTVDKPDGAGRFRRTDEGIRVTDEEGTVFHEPPAAEQLPERMKAMCEFANRHTPDFFVHPVIRAVLLHFWLAYDHPFIDGNGRTARALFYWSMLNQGFQLFEFISISQIILKAPVQYATAFLHVETDENDLTYFILHQTAVIEGAIKALHDYVAHRKAELAAAEQQLRGIEGLNHRQQGLLANALRNAGARYTIEGHKRTHGVVYQTARADLLDLESRQLLRMVKIGRAMVFRPVEDLTKSLASPDGSKQPFAEESRASSAQSEFGALD
jgi:Fic family protein